MMSATATPSSLPSVPYRGIEPFRYVDQEIFFSREKQTQRLLSLVTVYRGVLLYGGSGSGKSSLVNAGLIPAALTEGFVCERVLLQPSYGKEFIVERIPDKVNGQPSYLPSVFVDEGDRKAALPRLILSAEEFKERIKGIGEQRPLLIFDQFEEFITQFEEALRGEALKEARRAQENILKVLVEALRDHSVPLKLLFVFREDYLAKLNKLFTMYPDLVDQYMRLTPPGVDALHEIIRGSFEKFPRHFSKELSPSLAQDLETAIAERGESDVLNLSEVQIACLRLWQSPDPEGLFREKGVEGLLQDYLSDAINSLSAELRDPALALLSNMVTSSGVRKIVSEYDLITEVCKSEGIGDEELLKNALATLVTKAKLVRPERRFSTYFYSIVSEFLVPWITEKKAERRAEKNRRDLAEAEQRKRKRANRIAVASLLVTVIVTAVAVLIVRVRTQAAIAEGRVEEAETRRAEIEKRLKETDEKATLLTQKNNELEKMVEAFAQQKAEGDKVIEDLNTNITTLTNRLNSVRAERDRLKTQVSDAQTLQFLAEYYRQQYERVRTELERCKSNNR